MEKVKTARGKGKFEANLEDFQSSQWAGLIAITHNCESTIMDRLPLFSKLLLPWSSWFLIRVVPFSRQLFLLERAFWNQALTLLPRRSLVPDPGGSDLEAALSHGDVYRLPLFWKLAPGRFLFSIKRLWTFWKNAFIFLDIISSGQTLPGKVKYTKISGSLPVFAP